jgi:anti-sigma-K factor RskA
MSCEELRDHYELYAMGVAGEPETNEIREHLNRGCEVCMAEMKRARALTTVLGTLSPPAAPSSKLRRRILISVGAEPRSYGWMALLAAAAALSIAAAAYLGMQERGITQEANRLRQQAQQQNVELARLNEAFAIVNGADTRVVTFGAGPKGRVFVNPSQGVLLVASNLPPAPAGKVYEMWIVPKSGNPARAGEFQPDAGGTAMHIRRGAVDPGTVAAVAVTVENEGGSDTPTMPLVIAAPLGG